VNYVTECCLSNAKVEEEHLVDLLEDIMDQEFDTICDDNSIKEISASLVRYLTLLKEGQLGPIQQELSQLPPCEMWIVPGRRINFVSNPESSSDDDDDDEDEDMDVGGDGVMTENTTAPSTSGSTMQVEEEEVDPGWTVVKTKKKK